MSVNVPSIYESHFSTDSDFFFFLFYFSEIYFNNI